MKLTTGYRKYLPDSDSYVLLAGGGHKNISLIINDYGAMSISPAWTFSNPISGDLLGNATTADRLKSTTQVGGSTTPVYFANGVPVACTAYSSASVNYASSAGSVAWANTNHPSTFPPDSHTHGDITNDGCITSSAITLAVNTTATSADFILVSDTSESGKIQRGILLTGASGKFLTASGTWATPSYTTNTDASVKLTPTTTNSTYELLFSGTADNTEHTELTRKTSTLTYNPSTYTLGLYNATIKYNSSTACLEITC